LNSFKLQIQEVKKIGIETISCIIMNVSGFSISEYHNVKEIYGKLDKLIDQPIRPVRKDKMQAYLEYFDRHCPKSKEMIGTAMEFIPGGVQHNLAFNYPFPLVFSKAEGAYLYDLDGNKYIDFIQAGGPTVIGSNNPVIRGKAIEVIMECGPSTGLFHEYELKIAEFICRHIPSVDQFRMLGSGTEAVMASIRVARLATGKKKIIKMGGAYHGWSDQLVYGMRIPGTGRFDAHGIPRSCSKHTQEVLPNNIKALKRKMRWNKFRGGTAAVILEPVGPESGTRPIDFEYNAKVRELCTRFGALLIFDEVVTAFRIGLSGAQGYFNVMPDLTVFGKVVAGGYPSAGGLGGKKEYMSYLAAGLQGAKKKAMVGGTMAANPLSSAAGYHTLLEIEKTDACAKAGRAGDRLTKGLQQLIEKYNLPFVAYNQGSICHLETSATMFVKVNLKRPWTLPRALKEIKIRKHMMEEMGAAYMAEGIVTVAGSRMYISSADTDEIIDDALARFENVFQNIETAN
jgi:glutamate-1-semialdehyde 2,1-aminomutase